MTVAIENTGDSIWLREAAGGCGFVQLGAHLRDGNDKLLDYDYLRCPLPEDTPPGKRFELRAGFIAPDSPGHYTVEFDMVNEGISWFKDYRSETAEITVNVAS